MAKGLTRCNVCGKTVEQVFENQMLISIHDRIVLFCKLNDAPVVTLNDAVTV